MNMFCKCVLLVSFLEDVWQRFKKKNSIVKEMVQNYIKSIRSRKTFLQL